MTLARERDALAAVRARLSDHAALLKANNDRIAAALAKAQADHRPRSSRWT